MEINNNYDYICETKGKYPQLSHASNIITKYSGKLKSKEEDALTKLIPEYSNYLHNSSFASDLGRRPGEV